MQINLHNADQTVKRLKSDLQTNFLHCEGMERHERLKIARERKYEHAKDAAAAMDVPYGTYSGHESGSRGFAEPKGRQYAAKFRVRLPWLMLGEGPMEIGSNGGGPSDADELMRERPGDAPNSSPDAAPSRSPPSPPLAPPRPLDDETRELLLDFGVALLRQVSIEEADLARANEAQLLAFARIAVRQFEGQKEIKAHLASMGKRENLADQKANQATQKRSL